MLTLIRHPLVEHWIAELREETTSPPRFRQLVRSLATALFLEATRDLPLAPARVRTPLAEVEGRRLAAAPVLVPILRAGLGMTDGILELVPEARVCHVGIYRDHDTLEAVRYYSPEVTGVERRCAFLLDPMLATGGSAVTAARLARDWGVNEVRLLAILGAPEGVQRVEQECPGVPIYLCALDERLNEMGYIVPGLGDAGDRQYGL